MIARVCDCLIQVDVIGKKCKILANDVEVLSQVGRKLDNVEAAHVSDVLVLDGYSTFY